LESEEVSEKTPCSSRKVNWRVLLPERRGGGERRDARLFLCKGAHIDHAKKARSRKIRKS